MATVLLVDDTESEREILERFLQRDGYSTRAATDGRAALNTIEAHGPPDVILLDIAMPVMDGFDLLEHLRADPRWQTIPVVVMSAHGDTDSVQRATDLGANDYLVKTRLSLAEILRRVHYYAPAPPTEPPQPLIHTAHA